MLFEPSAATLCAPTSIRLLWREHTPKVCHACRTTQWHEHRRQDRGGMENPIQPVTDGDCHHKGRDQFNPNPRAYSPRGTAEPALIVQGLLWRGVEALLASGGFQAILERGI